MEHFEEVWSKAHPFVYKVASKDELCLHNNVNFVKIFLYVVILLQNANL